MSDEPRVPSGGRWRAIEDKNGDWVVAGGVTDPQEACPIIYRSRDMHEAGMVARCANDACRFDAAGQAAGVDEARRAGRVDSHRIPADVVKLIHDEIERASKKHGEQEGIPDVAWLVFAMEEVGEAAEGLIAEGFGKGDREHTDEELIHAIATLVHLFMVRRKRGPLVARAAAIEKGGS